EGPINAALDARLDALEPTLPFNATLTSDLLQWPLPGAIPDEEATPPDPWLLEELTLRAEGRLTDYRLAVSMMVEGPEVPFTRVALAGSGDLEHFAWTPLAVSLAGGSVVTRGRVDWAEALSVEAVARLDRFEPGRFVEGLDGRLDGDIEASFTQTDEGWNLSIPTLTIAGVLQDLPLSLNARLTGDSQMRWEIETLDFHQGDNRLNAAGRVSEAIIDLTGELNMPALASLHDQLSGTLTGRFAAGGSLDAPQLDLTLRGENLTFAENRVSSLRLNADISGIEDPALDVSLELESLNAAGQRFSEITLGLDGLLSDHRLTLSAQAGPGMPLSRAVLTLKGGLDGARERYRGELLPLEVDTEFGDIRLAQALIFEVNLPAGSGATTSSTWWPNGARAAAPGRPTCAWSATWLCRGSTPTGSPGRCRPLAYPLGFPPPRPGPMSTSI
ncbi:MAG: hypothetical protein LC652_06030, partial [Halomonas sp.]|nr:hypothetical protein [Halomonas sp.]